MLIFCLINISLICTNNPSEIASNPDENFKPLLSRVREHVLKLLPNPDRGSYIFLELSNNSISQKIANLDIPCHTNHEIDTIENMLDDIRKSNLIIKEDYITLQTSMIEISKEEKDLLENIFIHSVVEKMSRKDTRNVIRILDRIKRQNRENEYISNFQGICAQGIVMQCSLGDGHTGLKVVASGATLVFGGYSLACVTTCMVCDSVKDVFDVTLGSLKDSTLDYVFPRK